ncbi:MAG TPA: sensor histidine kinase [Streptosporangiaceae bacterium]|nr:sensor histidine kinase [Streptosporangiaceae bacterium]
MSTAAGTAANALHHWALFYRGPEEYSAAVTAFLAEGLGAGEPALVAVPGPNLYAVRASFPGNNGVTFIDMTYLGSNPLRLMPAIRTFTDSYPGQRTRFVGEPIWPGRRDTEVQEATRHEALINSALADVPTTILCPYDAGHLSSAVLESARHTHPNLLDGGQHQPSPSYRAADVAAAIGEQRLPGPPATAEALVFGETDLATLRKHAEYHARQAGLSAGRSQDFALAVNEAATNTVVHTKAAGTCRFWHTAASVTCDITDTGRITDPLAGRRPPPGHAAHGLGLWVINQVCDLTELRSGDWGTTVRMHMYRQRTAPPTVTA